MTTKATRSPRRRTVVALAVVLAILSGFVIRLVDIQVVNADEHVTESEAIALGAAVTLYGARGDIVDENGAKLATSTMEYDAELNPSVIAGIEAKRAEGEKVTTDPWPEVAEQIAAITGQEPQKLLDAVEASLEANPESQYALLGRGFSTETYRELAELDLPYLHFSTHPARIYPDGAVGGNIVGFLDSAGVPQGGIEALDDRCLAAEDGRQTYEVGGEGVTIPGSLKTEPAVDGGTVQLTINRDLNWYLQQMIGEEVQNQGAKYGSVMVVEVATGKIRAAAEYPTVDPNNVDASDPSTWFGQLFWYDFEPGSTFKPATAAMLLEEGVATPMTTVTAADREEFPNGAVVNDFDNHPTYNYTLAGALIDSSNVALSKFGTMLSADKRHDWLAKFGVGEKTNVGFPNEVAGVLHPSAEWDAQSLYTTTFGQYYTVTVPQVVSLYQTLANGGVKHPLQLVESCTSPDGTVTKPDLPESERVVSESTADQVVEMVENVAVQGGLSDQIAVPGYRIGGKTGTAQKTDGQGGYKSGVFYTSLVGFAPADDPQYIVMVTLDEPTRVTSSAATAPAFQKAMTQVLKTYRVMPSETPLGELLPKYK